MPPPATPIPREQIIEAGVSLQAVLGRSPRKIEFHGRTRITHRQLEHHFETWNDFLAAANLPLNRITCTSQPKLLDDWGSVTRKLGHCPSRDEYEAKGVYSRHSVKRHCPSWADVGRAFYARSVDDPQWHDVIKIIRDREARGTRPWMIHSKIQIPVNPLSSPAASNIAYGEPLDFKFLRNAPINEAGVVYLFGCLAPELGFVVEAIQPGFPDCEAKRKDLDGKLRRLRIEFEFESKNFLFHKHDITACDIIVCWRNNWPECPLEVIELSNHLKDQTQLAA